MTLSITALERDRMAARLAEIRPFLDERAWRLLLGAEARAIGYGGMKVVAAASKAKADTVSRGVRELAAGIVPDGRVRAVGGGRPASEVVDPGLEPALEGLVAPGTRGDPQSPLRWTTKSTSRLAEELGRAGHEVSADTVGRLLKKAGYSLQGNAKTVEGRQHPDRDAQFGYINEQVAAFQAAGDPVISVDAKKKELVGNFANSGVEWMPAGAPERVNVHDFVDKDLGKATPYGIHEVQLRDAAGRPGAACAVKVEVAGVQTLAPTCVRDYRRSDREFGLSWRSARSPKGSVTVTTSVTYPGIAGAQTVGRAVTLT